jgi:hypothetical protein
MTNIMTNSQYEIINVDSKNIEKEHICCAIGNDKTNRERAEIKKAWLKTCFPNGHVFKKVNVRGKVFIEYVPIEKAWFPILGQNYNFIQCFWVSGQYKGQGWGNKLYLECENDSKNTNGIIVLSTNKKLPFTVDKSFFIKRGFKVCDTAFPYFELLVKQFKDAPLPQFSVKAKKAEISDALGFTFFYNDSCPFVPAYVDEMINVINNMNLPVKKVKVSTLEQAKDLSSAFGIFSVFYKGKLITHELMTAKKFEEFVRGII